VPYFGTFLSNAFAILNQQKLIAQKLLSFGAKDVDEINPWLKTLELKLDTWHLKVELS